MPSMEDIFGAPAVPKASPAPAPGPAFAAPSIDDIFGGTAPAPSRPPSIPPSAVEEAAPQHPFHGQATGLVETDQATRDFIAGTADTPYQIRKRSGRIIGPFPTSKVLEMFQRGELLGSEDASTDGVTWRAMAQIPAFAAAIQEAMTKAMSGLEDLPALKTAEPPPSVGPSLQLAPLPAAMPDRSEAVPAADGGGVGTQALRDAERAKLTVERNRQMRTQRGFRLLAAAVVLLLIVAAGIAANFATPYGYFGFRLVFQPKEEEVKKPVVEDAPPPPTTSGTVEHVPTLLQRDTYVAYRQGADQSERVVEAAKDLTPLPDSAKKAAAQHARFLGYLVVVEKVTAFQPKMGAALAFADGDEVAKAVGEAAAAYTEQQWDKGMAVLKPLSDASRALPPAEKAEVWTWIGIGQRGKGELAAAATSFDNALQANTRSKLALYLQALTLRETGAPAEARDYLDKIRTDDPLHPRATILLGRLLTARSETSEEGAKLLVDASEGKVAELASPPQKAEALLGRADVAIAQRQYPVALRLSGQAVELVPLNRDVRLAASQIALRLRDYAAAKQNGTKLLEMNPDDIDGVIVQARADMGNRETLTAYSALQAAVKKVPDNAPLHYWFGVAARELSKRDEARKLFEKAAALDPTRADPVVELVVDYIDQGKLADALARAAEAENKIGPGDRHKIRAVKGMAFAKRHAYADAEKEYKKALVENPGDTDTRAQLATMLIAQKRLEDAEKELNEAQTLDAKNPSVLIAVGDVLAAKKDFRGALSKYEEAMQLAPNAHQPYIHAARAAAALKDFGRAKGLVDTAGQLRPGIAEVLAMQAIVMGASDASGATRLLQQACELSPEEPGYLYELGLLYANMAAPLEAIDALKKAVALDPSFADAFFHLGKVQRDLGRQREAREALERCLKLEPRRVDAWLEIAELAGAQNDDEGALRAYEKALQADPTNPASVCSMGETLVLRLGGETKNLRRGAEILERCVKLAPSHESAWVNLGNAYKTLGKKRDAIRAFKQHLQVNPEDSTENGIVRDQLADLEGR